MVDYKAAVVLDAEPSIHVEPLTDEVTFEQRQQIASAVKHELDRVRWHDLREDTFLQGAVCGVGIVMCRTEQDPLSGMHMVRLDIVDPGRFYPDPSATRLHDCRFLCYEPELDLSVIKEIFPDKGDLVRAAPTEPITNVSTGETRLRSNDEIIYGPGTEISYGTDGGLRQRKANVCFVWIKQGTLSSEVQTSMTPTSGTVQECQDCGAKMDPGHESAVACPSCASENLAEIPAPPKIEANTVISREYPFGRLIVYSGEVLLYDGPNPYNLDSVFPFAAYMHYRHPKRFWAQSDVTIGKSTQMVLDRNMAQLIEAMRVMVNGPFEYPAEAEGYTNLGNAPGQMVPVALPFMGKARWVSPAGFNAQLWQVGDETAFRDMQRQIGVTDVSQGLTPTAPTSGVEIQARLRAAGTRIGKHLNSLNRFDSELASLVWKIMQQYYVGPRNFQQASPVPGASEFSSIVVDCSQLPSGVAVRVDANIDSVEKDKNMGQNLVMALTNPQITNSPMFDILMEVLLQDPVMAREIKDRMSAVQQEQAQAPPPPPPPSTGAQILVAISDLVKAGAPVAHNQLEAALMAAGLPPPDISTGFVEPPQTLKPSPSGNGTTPDGAPPGTHSDAGAGGGGQRFAMERG